SLARNIENKPIDLRPTGHSKSESDLTMEIKRFPSYSATRFTLIFRIQSKLKSFSYSLLK
ncbi:MAG: hypothetical protein AAFR31_15485, partial [Cyanobacteria bacterium J06627_8]